MAQTDVMTAVDRAITALQAARKALAANTKQETRSKPTTSTKKKVAPVRRGMSEEGRLRIAEAQRKRWAVQKRAAKKAARLAAR